MASICVYEDEGYKDLLPICWMRPVFDLRCGITTLLEKIRREYPRANTYVLCRDYLSDILKGSYPGTIINKFGKETMMLFLNGQIVFDSELAKMIPPAGPDEIFEHEGRIIAARLNKENLELVKSKIKGIVQSGIFSMLKDGIKVTKINVKFISRYFDLIKENGGQIEKDFISKTKGGLIKGRVHQQSVISPKGSVFVDDGSNIGPFVVIDAKDGPVYIGKGVDVQPFSLIQGPAYIGDRCVILGAKIRKNTSIGQYSKISGEVSNCIFQGYCNKQHEGFTGHTYFGEWVNLGAGTTTSNLKSNYGTIKTRYMDQEIDTKQMFLGAAISDHAKTGIATLINAGSIVGVASSYFGGGPMPKFMPSFAWGSQKDIKTYEIDKAVKTAEIVMKRRGIEMTEAEVTLFGRIFDMTETEREYHK